MRILFISPKYLPEIGGVERHVEFVAKKLLKEKNDVKIITGTNKKIAFEECLDSIHVYRISQFTINEPRLENILKIIVAWLFLIRNFRLITNSDVIHLHDYQTFLWIMPFISMIRKPIYITFHGFESYPIPRFAKIIRKIAEKVSKGNICVGNFIMKWYGTTPNYVTIGAVEIIRPQKNFPSKDAAIFLGRLAEDSSILRFIESLKILKENYSIELPLHVYGEGPLKNDIVRYAKENELKIFIHGFVKRPINHFLQHRYAFVSGFLSILEAMSLKIPVFTIYENQLKKDYFNSIPNVEKLIFMASSPTELAEKIFTVEKKIELTKMSTQQAYNFAIKQKWEDVTKLYLKLYKKK